MKGGIGNRTTFFSYKKTISHVRSGYPDAALLKALEL
jgi:hypothetical protein